jgi:hypothetical protein
LLPVAGSERLHSQGAGTGFECSEGICAGPREVNHELQRHGIEQSVRDVYGQKRSDVELWQKTVVRQHPGSNQLSEIQYEISARTVGSRSAGERLYSTSIVVDRSGKSHVPADSERLNPNIEEYLRPLPNRNRGPQQQIGQHVRQTPQKGNLAKQLPSPSAAGNTRHSGLKQGRQEALVHSRGRSTNHVAQRSKSRSIRPGR